MVRKYFTLGEDMWIIIITMISTEGLNGILMTDLEMCGYAFIANVYTIG
jgi:hypothetical protein